MGVEGHEADLGFHLIRDRGGRHGARRGVESQRGRHLFEEVGRNRLHGDAGVAFTDLIARRIPSGESTFLVDAEAGRLEEGHIREALDDGLGIVQIEDIGSLIAEVDLGIVLGLIEVPECHVQGDGTARAGHPIATTAAEEPEVEAIIRSFHGQGEALTLGVGRSVRTGDGGAQFTTVAAAVIGGVDILDRSRDRGIPLTVRRGQGRAIECPGDVRTRHRGYAADEAILDGAEARGVHVQGRHQVVVGRAVVPTIFDRHIGGMDNRCRREGTCGGEGDGVGPRRCIRVRRRILQVDSRQGCRTISEVPGVMDEGRIHPSEGDRVGIEAIGGCIDSDGEDAGRKAQLSAVEGIQADTHRIEEDRVQREAAVGWVRNREGGHRVAHDDGRDVNHFAGARGSTGIGGDDVEVESVRDDLPFPVSGQHVIDVGVVSSLQGEHLGVVHEGLPPVIRERRVGPIVDRFARGLGRHPEGLHVGQAGAEGPHGAPHTEGNVAEVGACSVGPIVLVQISPENESEIGTVRLEVKGLDDLGQARGGVDIDCVGVIRQSICWSDGRQAEFLSLEVVQGEQEWAVRNGEHIRCNDPVVAGRAEGFPIGLAPVVGAVVVDAGHECSLLIDAVHSILVRGANDDHACALIDHLSEEVVVGTTVRRIEFDRADQAESRWADERVEIEALVPHTCGGDISRPTDAGNVHLVLVLEEIQAEQPGVKGNLGIGVLDHHLVNQGARVGIQHEHEAAITERARVGIADVADGRNHLSGRTGHHLHVGDAEQESGSQFGLPNQASILLLADDHAASEGGGTARGASPGSQVRVGHGRDHPLRSPIRVGDDVAVVKVLRVVVSPFLLGCGRHGKQGQQGAKKSASPAARRGQGPGHDRVK